jgi:hypothetical protein
MGQDGIRNAVKQSNAMVMRSSKNNSFGAKPTAHNGLVGGSSPPGPTTHSRATRDFLKLYERPTFSGITCARSVSAKRSIGLGANSGAFVSGLKISLPGNRDRREQRPVRHRILLRDEAKHLVLARPFGWQIGKTDDAHSVREPTFNSGFDEMGCEEGERDHHIDLSYAAAFSRRNCLCIG